MNAPVVVDLPAAGCGRKDLDRILAESVRVAASDVLLMGGEPVWMSIEGRKRAVSTRRLKPTEVQTMLSSVHSTGAVATLGTAVPIDMSYQLRVSGRDGRPRMARFRVNAVMVVRGGRPNCVATTWRLIAHTPPTVEALGLPDGLVEASNGLDGGLGLFVGATGHGKSTLMASLVRNRVEPIDADEWVVTIESPVEYVYDAIECPSSNVRQLEVGTNVKSFHGGVVCALRMAPTLLLVGESRDAETVEATLEAGLTGHAVFTTVHASSSPGALRRMELSFPEAERGHAKESLLQGVRFICAQRLLPGADGRRVAVREFLEIDGALRSRLRNAQDWFAEATLALLSGEHGWPMIEDAEARHREGRLDEDGIALCRELHRTLVDGG